MRKISYIDILYNHILYNAQNSVFVWNALGYNKIRATGCGYEYHHGTVSPASWDYDVTGINVSVKPSYIRGVFEMETLPKPENM